MSHKFIVASGYPDQDEEYLQEKNWEVQLTREWERNNENQVPRYTADYKQVNLLVIPTEREGCPYNKMLVECMSNAFKEFADALKITAVIDLKGMFQGKTISGVHESMVILVKGIARIMGYMVNSASWNDPEQRFHSFDRMEIATRLRDLATIIGGK